MTGAALPLALALVTGVAAGTCGTLWYGQRRVRAIKCALERSRSEVELFANSVPFVLWRSNPAGHIQYLNQSWTRVTGLDRWSVLADARYNDVVHPDDIAILNETVSAAIANQTLTDLKVRVRQADGSYRWMQIYDTPAVSPLTGEVERFGGLSDVHAEVMAKEELQAMRQKLESSQAELVNFTDSAPLILWRADIDGRIDFWNRRYGEVTGRAFTGPIAVEDYTEDFHPEDRAGFIERLRAAFSVQHALHASVRLRHANGAYRWMAVVGRPAFSAKGSGEVRYYGCIFDIHDEVIAQRRLRELNETLEQRVTERTEELMQTELRYARLFEVSNMTFAEMDFSDAHTILDEMHANGVTDLRAHMAAHPEDLARALGAVRTTRVNAALARLMGYASVEELVENPPQANADDGAEVLLRQLEMAFYGTEQIDGRTVLTGRGGRRIPIYYAVMRLPGGLHLSSHIDLSEQERIEGLRRATQAELARANRVATVGAFSASIAHELNQPITSLVMDAQTGLRLIARGNPDTDALTRILQRAERTAQRVAAIVHRTRETIMAGRRAVEVIDVCQLANETRDLLALDLSRASVELEILCDTGLAKVAGDRVELQQVFVNLVTNAADAMRDQPAGTRRITITIVIEGEIVRVRVVDAGPGIPEAHIEKLFDPFFTTKAAGIGMGLQICRSAVEAMGGQLTVANAPDGGACFAFDLPLMAD
ncbi:PAS domain-containing sensor histidine kinase [Novosphingobium sp.]|uniref:PAS domain-containing sensor histidine kinase n=1 Tax=Novosphingobium sp. TaxID=1874826 RepID=UPI002FDEF16D